MTPANFSSPIKFGLEPNIEIVNRNSVYKERFPKAIFPSRIRLKGPFSGQAPDGAATAGIRFRECSTEWRGLLLRARSHRYPQLPEVNGQCCLFPPITPSQVLEAEKSADRNLLRLLADGATRFLHHQIVEVPN